MLWKEMCSTTEGKSIPPRSRPTSPPPPRTRPCSSPRARRPTPRRPSLRARRVSSPQNIPATRPPRPTARSGRRRKSSSVKSDQWAEVAEVAELRVIGKRERVAGMPLADRSQSGGCCEGRSCIFALLKSGEIALRPRRGASADRGPTSCVGKPFALVVSQGGLL